MTAIATHTSQALTEWTKIFPKQVTENYTSSVSFMKQLTVIAVSTITYLKNAFPEESYTTEDFGGLKLRILKKKCRDELAQFLSTALTQAFQAFDMKYLHQLALCFYEGECKVENLVEYHVFEYSYNSDVASVSVRSKARDHAAKTTKFTFDSVREKTVHLIRACVVILQTCQYQLPENYDVSLRLYYNEDAPEGYQAPGFNPSMECEDHLEPTASEAIKLGCVETPFHRLVARTYIKDSMGASHEAIPSQNPPMMTQIEELNGSKETSLSECSGPQPQLCCPCNKGDHAAGDDVGPLLTCHYCNTLQHAVCFGLMVEDASELASHCCTRCSDEDPTRTPTDQRLVPLSRNKREHAVCFGLMVEDCCTRCSDEDPTRASIFESHVAGERYQRLVPLSRNKRECLCVFRRALWVCLRAGRVCALDLARALSLSDANAARLMRLLHSQAVVPLPLTGDTDLITAQKVSTDNLKSVMNKYFRVSEEQTIVDRLLAETFASQESQPDPVGDVLGPLEKVSLQSASNPGRIIENNAIHNANAGLEDPILKQYKEAVLADYQAEEDLPLSGSHDPIKDITNVSSKRTSKRKINENNEENKPNLRTGFRTKRAKLMSN